MREALKKELGDNLDSLILYGSIARGDYGPESDIDVLAILNNRELEDQARDISYDIDRKNDTVTSLLGYSLPEIERKIKMGSPFLLSVLEEGKIIYDNGTWSRFCKSFNQPV